MKTRVTTIFEKSVTSILNVLTVGFMFIPFYFIAEMNFFQARVLFCYLFLLHNLIPLAFIEKRDIGMVIMKTYLAKKYPLSSLLLYAFLYTLSFASLLFYVYFPFDLFLINMLILQLPTILLTGTTLHGWLAGKITTVKRY